MKGFFVVFLLFTGFFEISHAASSGNKVFEDKELRYGDFVLFYPPPPPRVAESFNENVVINSVVTNFDRSVGRMTSQGISFHGYRIRHDNAIYIYGEVVGLAPEGLIVRAPWRKYAISPNHTTLHKLVFSDTVVATGSEWIVKVKDILWGETPTANLLYKKMQTHVSESPVILLSTPTHWRCIDFF